MSREVEKAVGRTQHCRDLLHLLWTLARAAHLYNHLIHYGTGSSFISTLCYCFTGMGGNGQIYKYDWFVTAGSVFLVTEIKQKRPWGGGGVKKSTCSEITTQHYRELPHQSEQVRALNAAQVFWPHVMSSSKLTVLFWDEDDDDNFIIRHDQHLDPPAVYIVTTLDPEAAPQTVIANTADSLILNLWLKWRGIPVLYSLSSLISPLRPKLQIETKWTPIKILVHMLDFVTWVKLKSLSSQISFFFFFLGMFTVVVCSINGC